MVTLFDKNESRSSEERKRLFVALSSDNFVSIYTENVNIEIAGQKYDGVDIKLIEPACKKASVYYDCADDELIIKAVATGSADDGSSERPTIRIYLPIESGVQHLIADTYNADIIVNSKVSRMFIDRTDLTVRGGEAKIDTPRIFGESKIWKCN